MSVALDINRPNYYHRQYENDIKPGQKQYYSIKRITLVALPFLSLYKPLSIPISLVLGSIRSISAFSTFQYKFEEGTAAEISKAFLQTLVAVIALGGTLFAHPLGMLITTAQDCAFDCANIGSHLYSGQIINAIGSSAYLVNNSLYLALFLNGGIQIAVASLAMQVFIGLSESFAEYKKGNYLEFGGHFLMGMIRGHQLQKQMQILQAQNSLNFFFF